MNAPGVSRAVHEVIHADTGSRCDRSDCDRHAWYRVAVRVWAKAQKNRVPGNAAELRYPLLVCDECRQKLATADVVDDRGWAHICAYLSGIGAPAPDRASIEIVYLPLPVGGNA